MEQKQPRTGLDVFLESIPKKGEPLDTVVSEMMSKGYSRLAEAAKISLVQSYATETKQQCPFPQINGLTWMESGRYGDIARGLLLEEGYLFEQESAPRPVPTWAIQDEFSRKTYTVRERHLTPKSREFLEQHYGGQELYGVKIKERK